MNVDSDKTPEEIVAEQIQVALLEAGLLLKDRSPEFLSQLTSGRLKSQDWELEIDLATEPKETEDEQ